MTQVTLKLMGSGPSSRGEIQIWEKPVPDVEYILGADVAQGATFGSAKQNADMSTLCILRRDGMTLVQVAEADYRCENFQFGQIIAALGAWYNHAWINVERNLAHGVIAGLKSSGYPQERWYIPPVASSVTEATSWNYFFHKNISTSKVLIDTMLSYMDPEAPRLVLKSKNTLAEIASLQLDANGRVNTNGKDRTIALAMAIIVDATTEVMLAPRVVVKKTGTPPFGVDPRLWRQANGIEEPVDTTSDDAPDWGDSADLAAPTWDFLN